MEKTYVADTENTVPRPEIYTDSVKQTENLTHELDTASLLDEWEAESQTRVWCWALAPVMLQPTESDVIVDNKIESFIKHIRKLKSGSTIYFHNLAYDGPLLVIALMRMGYIHDVLDKPFNKPTAGTFTSTISDSGVWYRLSVTFHDGNRNIVFKDSLKILPFSVDAVGAALKTRYSKLKGSIDYSLPRAIGYQPTPEEIKYVKNDVLVMSEALALMGSRDTALTDSMTIGQACMTEYKKTLGGGDVKRGKRLFNSLFPELSFDDDEMIRRSYRGGWCYVNRQNPMISSNQVIDLRNSTVKGNTYDVNSLYPFAMYKKIFPVGEPIIADPNAFDFDSETPFVVRMSVHFTLKKDHLPFIQLKGGSIFSDNEYPTDSNGVVDLTLTGALYHMFMDHYDVSYIEYTDLRIFQSATGIFDEYIEHWYDVKNTATNPVDRMIAKLMLNNLYGKMAQSKIRNAGVPVVGEDGNLTLEVEEGEQAGGHIAVGAYITDYARIVTIQAAQANYERFLYADTDSIHIVGEAVDTPVGDEIGQWDHEATWDVARFTRQKTYIERVIAEPKKNSEGVKVMTTVEPNIIIKAAGATDSVKKRLLYDVTHYSGKYTHDQFTYDSDGKILDSKRPTDEVFIRFTHGLTEAGKLRRMAVTGGSVLSETTFRIHATEGFEVDPATGLAPTEWTVVH